VEEYQHNHLNWKRGLATKGYHRYTWNDSRDIFFIYQAAIVVKQMFEQLSSTNIQMARIIFFVTVVNPSN